MNKEQFERAKKSPDHGVLVHLVCNTADGVFYSEEPDLLLPPLLTVLCVETFFSAVCDGGLHAWFDLDHGQLAHRTPEALRLVGLPEYAEIAEAALRCHHKDGPLPAKVSEWGEHLQRIRAQHEQEDCSEIYLPLDAKFFELFHTDHKAFRDRLYAYILQHEAEFLQENAISPGHAPSA